MEVIKYPTGNFEVDWLLEVPNRALEENGLSDAIKYLIEKHNELVAEITNLKRTLNR